MLTSFSDPDYSTTYSNKIYQELMLILGKNNGLSALKYSKLIPVSQIMNPNSWIFTQKP